MRIFSSLIYRLPKKYLNDIKTVSGDYHQLNRDKIRFFSIDAPPVTLSGMGEGVDQQHIAACLLCRQNALNMAQRIVS
jgi:hypothetical protein